MKAVRGALPLLRHCTLDDKASKSGMPGGRSRTEFELKAWLENMKQDQGRGKSRPAHRLAQWANHGQVAVIGDSNFTWVRKHYLDIISSSEQRILARVSVEFCEEHQRIFEFFFV